MPNNKKKKRAQEKRKADKVKEDRREQDLESKNEADRKSKEVAAEAKRVTALLQQLPTPICTVDAFQHELQQHVNESRRTVSVNEARVKMAVKAFTASVRSTVSINKAALETFYSKFCPEKIVKIDEMCEKFKAAEIVSALKRKYGAVPEAEGLLTITSAPPTSQSMLLVSDFLQRGFVDFCVGSTTRDLCVGECVTVKGDAAQEIGVVRTVKEASDGSGDGGRVFSVAMRGGEVRKGVPKAAVVRCKNQDAEGTVKDYLQALEDRVGPDDDADGEKWKAQAVLAIKERWVQRGLLSSMDDPKYEKFLEHQKWARSFKGWCAEPDKAAGIDQQCECGGWSREEAGVLSFCGTYSVVLAASVRDSRPDYAALLHKYHRLLARRAQEQEAAPIAYKQLQGGLPGSNGAGLADLDQGWADLLQGQGRGGFRCLTASGITGPLGGTESNVIVPGGYRLTDWTSNPPRMVLVESPVVRFVSRAGSDAHGLHTAVFTDPVNLVFPPMTLFTVVKEEEPGWLFDGTANLVAECQRMFGGKAPTPVADERGREAVSRVALEAWLAEHHPQGFDRNSAVAQAWLDRFLLPAGADSTVYPVQQKLIVVEATYLLPTSAVRTATTSSNPAATTVAALQSHSRSKLCEGPHTLLYQNRRAYVRGLSEILFEPTLTMEQEWRRDKKWIDWKGRLFSAAEEWRYVVAEKARNREPEAGSDKGHEGWDIARFVTEINAVVEAAGGEPLTTEEVIACRLYSGPCHDQINNSFLREVGGVDDRHWRQRLAQVPSYTYSATVAILMGAIRKLSAVNTFAEGEEEKLLYRGVSGKLPDSFFEVDAQGMIAAVDTGLMSTTSERQKAMNFFKGKLAVLFVLHCKRGRDATGAHHAGAMLAPLSQNPEEAETLFPSLTLLSVMKDEGGEFMIEEKTGRNLEGEEVAIKEIHVTPSFV